jgi:arylsulfatase A-like enzyme
VSPPTRHLPAPSTNGSQPPQTADARPRVGRILAALEKTGQLKNTVVLFTSDNGGQKDSASKAEFEGKHGPYQTLGDNRPLRGWKGQLYEGGVRVPALVSWPGRLRAGAVTQTVSYLDWVPRLVGLAGGKPQEGWKLAGRDVWPLLGRGAKVPGQPLYWNTGRAAAVLDGDWKLIVGPRKGQPELYDLAADPAEMKDL